MASPSLQSPRFTKSVVAAMRKLYPEELADTAWDNVGLLQENIEPSGGHSVPPVVLLTNDLTVRVAEEAIRRKASVVVSYHPFIFRGLKSVSLADPQQRILLQLAQHNIAVYSPHTALDAAPGGMNDWLADMLDNHGVQTKRTVVQPIPIPSNFSSDSLTGYGRRVEFQRPVNLGRIIEAYAEGLGGLRYIMIARPKLHHRHLAAQHSKEHPTASTNQSKAHAASVKAVAICAGSGYGVLKNCDADLFVTGEMSHHDALRLTMLGKTVITVFHSNSERRFLRKRLAPQLLAELRNEQGDAEVLISEEDEDPFEIWDVKDMPSWCYDKK